MNKKYISNFSSILLWEESNFHIANEIERRINELKNEDTLTNEKVKLSKKMQRHALFTPGNKQ